MSLITLKSSFESQDQAFLFRCDFPQPIVIKPNSEVELINCEFRRNDGFVINANNNVFRIKHGAFSSPNYAQRLIEIPSGNYSGAQLTAEVVRQMNDAEVNSAFKKSDVNVAAGVASGWTGQFFLTGGDDGGPYIELTSSQNLRNSFVGSVSADKSDFVHADITKGTDMNQTTYMDQEMNTTVGALSGTWTKFKPKGTASVSSTNKHVKSNFSIYPAQGELNYILPSHQGKGIVSGTLSTFANGNLGYSVDDVGDFITTTGTGSGATYKITAVDAQGTITTWSVVHAGAGYDVGDELMFQDATAAGSYGQAGLILSGSVLPGGAAGFYRAKMGFSNFETFQDAPWLSDPNGAWSKNFGDYMVYVKPGDNGNGDPQIKVSYTNYSTKIQPPQPNWRSQNSATGRSFATIASYDSSYTKGDQLWVRIVRQSGGVKIYIKTDTAGNNVFGTDILLAQTGIGSGTAGYLSTTIKETKFPYLPYLYFASGANNDNEILFQGNLSNIPSQNIIQSQLFHYTRGQFPASQHAESVRTGDLTDAATDNVSASPGDALNLGFMFRGKEILPSDLVSNGGAFPDALFQLGSRIFPNDCNAGSTLGEQQGYITITTPGNPFTHKFTRPSQEIDEASYHIEIQELAVKSHNGFSTDIGKDIMVIPREQLQTGHIAGSLTWNSQYRIPVDLHNIDVMHLNSLTTYIRDSDGKFSEGLEKPTQLTIKISEKQDFSKSLRGALKDVMELSAQKQETQIANIGIGNKLF